MFLTLHSAFTVFQRSEVFADEDVEYSERG